VELQEEIREDRMKDGELGEESVEFIHMRKMCSELDQMKPKRKKQKRDSDEDSDFIIPILDMEGRVVVEV